MFGRGKKQRSPGAYVGLVAYGVGITEALPVAAAELSKSEAEVVHLIWASKTFGDTFWHDSIAEVQRFPALVLALALTLAHSSREHNPPPTPSTP